MAAPVFKLPVTQAGNRYTTTRNDLETAVQEVTDALDDRISAVEELAEGGNLLFGTWAELEAVTGTREGQRADVRGDAGTHTDPVTSATVDNEGIYRWSIAPVGWERVSDLSDEAVATEVAAARQGKASLADNLTDMRDDTESVALASAAPNVWPDPEMRENLNWSAKTAITKTTVGGYPGFTFVTNDNASPPVPRARIRGGTVSWSALYTKPMKANQTISFIEYDDEDNALATSTVNLPSEAVTTPTRVGEDGITINASTAYFKIEVAVDGNQFDLADIVIAGSPTAKARPSLRKITDAIDAFAEVATKPNLLSVEYLTDPNLWDLGTGTITATVAQGRTALQVTGGSRQFYFPRDGIPGDSYSFSIVIEDKPVSSGETVRVLLEQRDDSNTNLGRLTLDINNAAVEGPQEWRVTDVAIDSGCTKLLIRLDATNTSELTVSRICLVAGGDPTFRPPLAIIEARRTIYVDLDSGNDSNSGAYASQMATISAAIQALEGRGKILVSGAQSASINISGAVDLSIEALPEERPKIISGTAVTDVSKTGGYTNVYDGTLASSPNNGYLLVDGMPEGEIALADRHALHWGQTYRSPVHRLTPQNSIENVDANPGTYFWDDGTVYFHLPGSEDGTEYTVYRPGAPAGISGAVAGQAGFIRLVGLEVYFASNGVDLRGVSSYEMEDVHVFGCSANGFRIDWSSGVGRRLSALQCNNDGFNLHSTPLPTPPENYRDTAATFEDIYAALCADDGFSNHERCRVVIRGGLFEFNGNGLTPASAGELAGYDLITRGNTVAGYTCATVVDSDEGGYGGTSAELWNCVAIDEAVGFRVQVTDKHIMRCWRPLTINCTVGASCAFGRLEMIDWRDSGSGTANGGATDGGTLLVVAPTAVTP